MSITQHQEGHRPSAAGVLEAAGEGHRIRIALPPTSPPRLEAPHCLLKQNQTFIRQATYAMLFVASQNAVRENALSLLKF
jgi:hypothetical protein